jgi:hypothetical protein
MDAQNLYQIILDQREELAAYQSQTYVTRREAEQLDFDSKLTNASVEDLNGILEAAYYVYGIELKNGYWSQEKHNGRRLY